MANPKLKLKTTLFHKNVKEYKNIFAFSFGFMKIYYIFIYIIQYIDIILKIIEVRIEMIELYK